MMYNKTLFNTSSAATLSPLFRWGGYSGVSGFSLTASVKWVGEKWAYFIVSVILLWPKMCCSTNILPPRIIKKLANVWRRTCVDCPLGSWTPARVVAILKDLIQLEAVEFKKDKKDTRLKHVYLSDKGLKLFEEVFSMQKKRIYKALLNSSSNEVVNFNNVLNKIIDE